MDKIQFVNFENYLKREIELQKQYTEKSIVILEKISNTLENLTQIINIVKFDIDQLRKEIK